MIKKRIKMQLKKAVSTFAGTALSGILCAVLLTGCGTLQNGEMPLPAESETSRSNDQTEEKTKGEDAEDGEITGSTEKTDDTEETKTSGTGKTVPEIWNREWPSNVDLRRPGKLHAGGGRRRGIPRRRHGAGRAGRRGRKRHSARI